MSDPLVPGSFQSDLYRLAQLEYQDTFGGNTLQVSARLFAGAQQYRSMLTYGSPTALPGSFRLILRAA